MVAWHDFRFFASDIYCQRVSITGASYWAANGVAVCSAAGAQQNPVVVPDGAGGFILAWTDGRGGSTPDFSNVFAQRLSAAGASQWTPDGISVCSAPDNQGYPSIAPDGANGTIFAWGDVRSASFEVYAQRIDNVYGYWGHPEPIVESVDDIPHDQGGKVAVNWTASGRDLPNPRAIDFYSVWRAVDAIPSGAAAISSGELSALSADETGPVYLATPGRYFERVGTQTAHGWPGYSFAASTRSDSVAASPGNEVFMVAAHIPYDTYVAFASNEVAGHSVDNLAPLAPFLLTAQRVGADVQLTWNRAVAPDLRDYAVYRATASGVTPVPIHFLTSAEDTLAVDANAPSSALYYIVTAYDVHANQSAPSNEANVGALTDAGNTPALAALTVLQNHPNPFNATTEFEIGLPSAAKVRIEVFDVAGRRVSTLEVDEAKAGWNRIPFASRDNRGRPLASGVYFYRVKAVGASITKKMVIAR
ncbi:MAG TPA: T9SS type A sorting domain-containing protein [Candidatus Krumholzibacteria bacterium]|nr:T9SS type A sorting domain-containing protein [Candidatus Krumholzibacteria bacterium]